MLAVWQFWRKPREETRRNELTGGALDGIEWIQSGWITHDGTSGNGSQPYQAMRLCLKEWEIELEAKSFP